MKTRINRTRYTVLGMLSIKPMSGYEIKQMIQTSTAFFWSESEGQIYPALTNCVTDGLATCVEMQSEGTQRIKKMYSITKVGEKALIEWLHQQTQEPLIRHELLLKLFFGANNDVSDNIYHVKQHEKSAKELLQIYQNLKTSLTSEHKKSPHLPYWLITIDFGIKSTEAELEWCQKTCHLLQEKLHD